MSEVYESKTSHIAPRVKLSQENHGELNEKYSNASQLYRVTSIVRVCEDSIAISHRKIAVLSHTTKVK